ncbi:MAG TPA: hypothetical protein VJI12_01475 [archaeon]|nr:hypothetical protein [archaeon]
MAIFEKETKSKEGEEELPHQPAQISPNRLGKLLAAAMTLTATAMILLYFWPQIASL